MRQFLAVVLMLLFVSHPYFDESLAALIINLQRICPPFVLIMPGMGIDYTSKALFLSSADINVTVLPLSVVITFLP